MPTSKAISTSKFLGKNRYEYYLNELLTEKTLGGHKLSSAQLKEGFSKRKNKINFEKFVDGVITKKVSSSYKSKLVRGVGSDGSKYGPIVKSQSSVLQKYDGNDFEKSFSAIIKSIDSIGRILAGKKKLDKDNADFDRKKAEKEKRALAESKLEKRFDGLKKVAEKVLSPVKSILDRITDFLVTVLLGRVVFKLIEWWGDPKNADKVKSIIRFFGDHWPKLLALYLTFGNSLGRFVLRLTKSLAKGAVKLLSKIALLAAAKKMRGARGAARFLSGRKGRVIGNVVGTGLALGGAYAAVQGFKGTDGGEQQKSQGFSGGGYVKPRFPTFSGGGFNFKGMLGGAGIGAMFGPLGMLLGGALGGSSGFVSGEKGIDKIPAMLSDGEFVMSRGAVAKYGVDTLEAMNSAGGGTNRPKIVSGSAYAYGGGLIGQNPDPNYKDPILDSRLDLMKSLEKYAKIQVSSGGNVNLIRAINNLSTTLKTGSSNNISSGGNKVPTGSLITDPLGAIQRMSGVKMPGLPGGVKMPGLPGPVQEVLDKLKGPGAATYADAGAIYAKQMLGGFGGPVSERDLSKESQAELQKAIQRAKKRTGSEIRKVEGEIQKLKRMGAKDGNPALERQKSFLSKLKSGGTRVQYIDYADEKGQMSESAKNAKNILGQFWAYERDKKEGGGYRIEDKYDFDMFKKKVKDPKTGKMGERDFTGGELWNEGFLGKGKTTQQRLQALYLLNPFKGKGDVDMVLGGNRTAAESWGLSSSKTLLGGMLGASGKPKDKNTQALEAKRPGWDKMGWFGGASGQIARDKKAREDFLKKNPGATLYNKPKAQIANAKPSVKPVPPPVKPQPKVAVVQSKPANRYDRRKRSSSNASSIPNFKPSSSSSSKRKVLGIPLPF